jgi:hypothetical protein
MTLTHKERLRRALQYEPVDRLPTQVNYTAEMGHLLAAHFEVSLAALPARLDNHMVRVDLSHQGYLSEDGLARFDWWGVGWTPDNTGLLIAPSHRMMKDIPMANVEALLATFASLEHKQ